MRPLRRFASESSRNCPATTTCSPAARPSRIATRSPLSAPAVTLRADVSAAYRMDRYVRLRFVAVAANARICYRMTGLLKA